MKKIIKFVTFCFVAALLSGCGDTATGQEVNSNSQKECDTSCEIEEKVEVEQNNIIANSEYLDTVSQFVDTSYLGFKTILAHIEESGGVDENGNFSFDYGMLNLVIAPMHKKAEEVAALDYENSDAVLQDLKMAVSDLAMALDLFKTAIANEGDINEPMGETLAYLGILDYKVDELK